MNNLKPMKILVVEDNAHFIKLYTDMLRIFGFTDTTLAENGKEAIEKIKKYQGAFDLIISDWEMPEMNGIELLKFIRTSDESPDQQVPVLLATGMGQERHVAMARDLGANEFLVKPFKVEDFRQRMQAVCTQPRAFVVADGFAGPCRRRRTVPLNDNQPERRQAS
jgi:CheY-like chemotaxis protein